MGIMSFFSKLKKRERGVLLVDALIGITVLAIGLVALLQLFTYGTKNRADASLRQKAVQIAAERIEMLKTKEMAGAKKADIIALSGLETITLPDNENFKVQLKCENNEEPLNEGTTYKGDDNIMVVSSTVTWTSPEFADNSITLYTYILLNQ